MICCAPRGGPREGAGRKSELPGEPKESKSIRYAKSELEIIKERAKKAGITASEYIRKKSLEP